MSNPFVAPPINTVKPFEPPQFDVIRDLLARKFIEMEMNPFGVQGAPTGSGLPLPPSWSSSGMGGSPGARWDPMTGSYGSAGPGSGTPSPSMPGPRSLPGGRSGSQPNPMAVGPRGDSEPEYEAIRTPIRLGYYGSGGNTPDTGNTTPGPSGGGASGGGGNPWSSSGGYPWLQGYQGQMTAPMNQWETGAFNNYQDFFNRLGSQWGGGSGGAGGGMTGGGLNMFGGGAPMAGVGGGAGNSAAMDQIEQGARGWQDYENQQALRRIASSAAAGGNALSGARMQEEGDYLNNAGNLFNQTMGTMRLQNLQHSQDLANALAQSRIGAQATLGAAGQYAGAQRYGANLGYQENMAGLQNQALMNMFGMGQAAQGTEQNQYNAAYNDWLRQNSAMQNQFGYPDQFGLSQLAYGRYGNQQPNAYGDSQAAQWYALLQQLMGGQGQGGGNNVIGDIVSGYNQGSGGGDAEPAYDGGSTPTDMVQGRDYWINKLNASEAASRKAASAGQPSAGAQTASGILQLLNLLMRGSGSGSSPNSTMSSGAAGGQGNLGLLGLLAKGIGALTHGGKKTTPGMTGNPSSLSVAGKDTPNPSNPLFDPNNFAQNYPDTNNPLFDPNNFSGNYPDTNNPLFDPNNFAGNPNDSYNDPSSPYYNDPLFDPTNFAGGDGGMSGGDMWAAGGGDMGAGGVDFDAVQ